MRLSLISIILFLTFNTDRAFPQGTILDATFCIENSTKTLQLISEQDKTINILIAENRKLNLETAKEKSLVQHLKYYLLKILWFPEQLKDNKEELEKLELILKETG